MKITNLLKAARTKLENPNSWTKDAFARNSQGIIVRVDSPEATCWCVVGALDSQVGTRVPADSHESGASLPVLFRDIDAACEIVQEQLPDDATGITDYNNLPETTHENILELMDRAIKAAESKKI